MGAKILESNNYEKFELTEFNRDVKKTKYLDASMRKHGWIDAYPAHVVRNGGGKLLIKAGHHRFTIAIRLGIPVKYVECNDNSTIHELEKATTKWTLEDYLTSYARSGKEAYLVVEDYRRRTGIGLSACISMLAGDSAGSGNWQRAFKEGTYRLGNLNHSRVVEAIIKQCKDSGFPYSTQNLFVQAVSKIAWAEGFASEVLKDKIKTFVQFMKKQATKQDYIEMLDSIYNRQSHVKMPLAFLAEEAARKRNVIKSLE